MEELMRNIAELEDQNIDLMDILKDELTEENVEQLLTALTNAIAILATKAKVSIRDNDIDGLIVSLISISTCSGVISATLGVNLTDEMERPEIDKQVDEVLDLVIGGI